MLKNRKRNFILILILMITIMGVSIKSDYENIIKMFTNISYIWLFIALFIVYLGHIADASFICFYVKIKDRKRKYNLYKALQVQQAGVFFSAITPSSTGGQFAQILVLSKQGFNSKKSSSMLMLSFISWQTILVLFSMFVLIFNYKTMVSTYSNFINIVFIGFTIDLVVITSLFLMAFSKSFHSFIFSKIIPLLGKIKIVKNVEKKKEDTEIWLTLFRDEFKDALAHKKIMLRRIFTDIIRLLSAYTIPFFAAKALNIDVDIHTLLAVIVLTSFVYMMSSFVPLPGASGGTEGMFVLLFGVIFGPATTSIMLLWRTLKYYIPMLVGFIFFTTIKELKE